VDPVLNVNTVVQVGTLLYACATPLLLKTFFIRMCFSLRFYTHVILYISAFLL
jgi:hypothetical protein